MYVGLAHVILHIYDLKIVTIWLPDLLRPSGFFVLDQKPPYLSEYHEISKFEISPPADSPEHGSEGKAESAQVVGGG